MSRDVSLPAAMPATLPATGFELVLHVECYEFPHFDTGWDANALCCLIDLRLERYGRFHASQQPIIYTSELERFANNCNRSTATATAPAGRPSSMAPTRSA